ncbi:pyridoxal phosphate-dependent transferase [Chytridium lagenaria]|nr:pyridoxal phosphate-dependent transferase [Chytridium lagenaria]
MPLSLPSSGWDLNKVTDHLLDTIAPALAPGHAGPRYFGFVTGGVTHAATLADFISTSYDNSAQVHLPNETITTTLESRTLEYILDLLDLDRTAFPGRTFTTGATASNILGLACGREHVMKGIHGPEFSTADEGLSNCRIRLFHVDGHASVGKAASVIGVGRRNCVNLAKESDAPEFDLERNRRGMVYGCIVVSSHGEVNTGRYTQDIPGIRKACDKYGAWLHVDAAFGAFAGTDTYLELADSITSDAHKWLNVPYDCGIFFSRSLDLLQAVFSPTFESGGPGPAYLLAAADSSIPSPLTIGIENSRRFRALPLYASLLNLGKQGYKALFKRNVDFSRDDGVLINIVLFAASECAPEVFRDEKTGGAKLAAAINALGKIYVTATVWKGRSAVRIAVSNWRTGLKVHDDVDMDDFEVTTRVLRDVMAC